jgi:hypothetical protein
MVMRRYIGVIPFEVSLILYIQNVRCNTGNIFSDIKGDKLRLDTWKIKVGQFLGGPLKEQKQVTSCKKDRLPNRLPFDGI